ncbi:MAG: glycosyltransferase [Vicinamibacteria bacterium]
MRILFLAPQPFFEVRGTPLAVRALLRALGSLGHTVDLLSFPQGEDVAIPGVRQLRSPRLPVGRVKAGPSLAKLLLDVPFALESWARMLLGRYDAVHAVEEAAHLASPLARLLGLPLVADVDSQIPDQLRYSGFAGRGPLPWLAELLDRHALRNATAVVTVCRSLSEGVLRIAPAARVFQIEDPPLFGEPLAADAPELASLRDALGLRGRRVALYSGNFEPYQGVGLLVEAAPRVPDASFLFMGGEPHEIEALRLRAAALGAAERCVFAGKRPPSELPAFLALADVLVSPRVKGENTPFKIYSYLASGRPLVATRLPTHTQVLDDSVAFLVEPTAEALAGGVSAALADPAEAGRRAARARDLLQREYSEARHLEKVKAAYAYVESRLRH